MTHPIAPTFDDSGGNADAARVGTAAELGLSNADIAAF